MESAFDAYVAGVVRLSGVLVRQLGRSPTDANVTMMMLSAALAHGKANGTLDTVLAVYAEEQAKAAEANDVH